MVSIQKRIADDIEGYERAIHMGIWKNYRLYRFVISVQRVVACHIV